MNADEPDEEVFFLIFLSDGEVIEVTNSGVTSSSSSSSSATGSRFSLVDSVSSSALCSFVSSFATSQFYKNKQKII